MIAPRANPPPRGATMKQFYRLVFGTVLAFAATFAAQAQSLSPTGITATPATGLPGDSITYAITVNNGAATQFGPGATANYTVLLTNITTGSTFSVGPVSVAPTAGLIAAATTDPTTGAVTAGTGTFTITSALPTQTLQAGSYSARVTLNSVSVGSVGTSTFTVSTGVVTVTGKPDLAITRLDYAAGTSYVGGQVIAMSLDYVNNISTNGVNNVPYNPGVGGFPSFVRIQVVLSSNPTFGDADDFQLTIHSIASLKNADGAATTLNWTQILPGNFSGSYYVLAKIDSLNALSQNDPGVLTVNGNNVWVGNAINPSGTLINLLPSNFPTSYLASHGSGATTTASGYSDNPSISSDGRYVAFASDAINLVSASSVGGADTNGARDIFLFDGQTSVVRRLSVSQQGTQGNGASNNPAISANGRYVAFASDANNLVIGDTNGFSDIYVVDTLTGLISRISGANATGAQANNPSFRPSISQTGRYIVFESTATNLTATTTATGVSHIYLFDRDVNNSGTFDTAGNTSTKLVDSDFTTPAAVAGNASAIQATISSDGTMIAFASKATNLVAPATTAARQHVFTRPLANVGTATSGIRNVSVVTTTAAEGNADSQTPSLNSTGRYIAFASLATNLVAGDTNAVSDIFVYDGNAPVGTPIVTRQSVVNGTGAQATDPSAAGFKLGSINPTISADGRYVAFASLASNLTSGDTNGQSQLLDSNNALDVFVHDRDSAATGTFDTGATATQIVSVNPFGYQTNGLLGVASTASSNIYPVISANGRFVAFPSDAENNAGLAFGATNLLPLDSNGLRDVFVFDRRTNATVTPATPPTVTITSPGNGSTALVNTAISLTASGTTSVGVVSSVQFFVNGTSLGSSSVFPYSASWTPTAVGTYTLSALVTDSFGNIGVSPNVTVNINAAPSVGLTAPVGGTTVTVNTAVSVTATAAPSNPSGSISSVQFFANGASIAAADTTAPYAVTWTPTVTGTFTLTAVATETIGSVSVQKTSPAVTVSVITPTTGGGGGGTATPPVVALTPAPPTVGSVNSRITLTAAATAGSASTSITKVEFFAGGVLVGSATAAPYTFVWVPVALGNYAVSAVATDNLGATTTSLVANVNINSVLAIALNSPSSGVTIPVNTPQILAATASATNGTVVSVQFLANGASIGTATAFPYTLTWTPATPGTYALTAVALDNTGAQAISVPNTITVSSGTAPSVAIASPASGSTVAVGSGQTLVANATAGSGTIVSVQFFANGVALGTDTTFPYNQTWSPTGTGAVALTAIATDSLGNRTTSAVVNVVVAGLSVGAPTVALTAPLAGSSLPVGVATTVAATATDADGTIASVQFFANGVSLGSKGSFPFNAPFTPSSPGTYVLTAQAIDNGGNLAMSSAISVTVGGGTAPSVSITAPAAAAAVGVNTPQTITANASSAGGVIAGVQFFVNGVSLSTDNSFPYAAPWTPTALGTYSLTARATDNIGNITDSAPVVLVVSASTAPTVALTNPDNGSSYTVGTTLNLAANAADTDGTISGVQFLVNGVPQGGVDNAAPYAAPWTPTSVGVYSITAQATDNTGNVTTSTAVNVTIGANAAPTVAMTSPSSGLSFGLGNFILLAASAGDSDGTVASVQFFANGLSLGTVTAAPYNFSWRPTVAGTYTVTALATDNVGNTTTSTPVFVTITSAAAPAVNVTNPTAGTTYVVGNPIPFVAGASGGNGPISQVQFFVNGVSLGTDNASPYSANWAPLAPGTYNLLAVATDSAGISSNSSALTIQISGNASPTVAITSPASGTSVVAGTVVNFVAAAADADGTVASVRFIANGNTIGTATSAPFTAPWIPSAAGSYSVTAQATDNSGNVTNSSSVTIAVSPNVSPVVVLTAPANGSVVRAGSSTTITASATDADGTIASVQFFANGTAVGPAVAVLPYRIQWTPNGEGVYRLTSVAIDNAGAATTSSTLSVLSVSATSGGADSIYTGDYSGNGEIGRFAAITVRGKTAAFIGYSTTALSKTYYFPGLSVDGGGNFAATDALGRTLIAANANDTGLSGALDSGRVIVIGLNAGLFPAGRTVVPGYYTGNLSGRAASTMVAIVGADASITLYVADGVFQTAGAGSVDAAGNFTVNTASGNRFTGKADPATGFLTGTMSGANGGSFMAATSSGVSFSDGFLRNLSTRGQVGTGSNILIAGFVVGGTAPKQVLIRAIGPTLTAFGLAGALADPQLQIFNSSNALVMANNNWGGAGEVIAASGSVGAFPLAVNSLDAVILASLAPGAYTAQVSGVSGGTGVALVELYDVDTLTPFSTQKVMNVATRGVVGTGQAQLIAGFVVSGNTAKKVLVRAVGPTLAAGPFNVAGTLTDPFLRLVRSDNVVVRENDNWESGNDGSLVNDASIRVGAFPLAAGSKDAAILINLPPGTYSAQVTGAGTTTGVALIEVYEVP